VVDCRAPSATHIQTRLSTPQSAAGWIGQLAASARDKGLDARAFVRRTDRLLGLLAAHFEVEDQVFLPVLDRALPVRK